jgi:hypothetical protein
VEFPGSGDDIERTVAVRVGGVSVLIIICEDFHLDRVRQATVGWPRGDVGFDSALAITLTNYIRLDWGYIRSRIRAIADADPKIGNLMIGINRRVRSRARRALLSHSVGGESR